MEHSHLHFREGHPGKAANCLRVRCPGNICAQCLKMPCSQDQDENTPGDAVKESAPNNPQADVSQTEYESSSEEASFIFNPKDASGEDSSLCAQSFPAPTPAKETPPGVKSMGNAEPEFSNLHPEQEHSGDEVDE